MSLDFKIPLYDFYSYLQNDFELGIDEYKSFIQSMEFGFGVESKHELFSLCKLLWFKPNKSFEEFQNKFEYFFQRDLEFYRNLENQIDDEEPDQQDKIIPNDKPEKKELPKSETSPSNFIQDEIQAPSSTSSDKETAYLNIEHIEDKDYLKGSSDKEFDKNRLKRFQFLDQYHPITERQFQIEWNLLKNHSHQENSDEVDMELTLKQWIHNQFLSEFVYKKKSTGELEVVVWIDHEGSMLPFHELVDHFLRVAKSIGIYIHTLYFKNLPKSRVFLNQHHTDSIAMDQISDIFRGRDLPVFVISDAGSARFNYLQSRVNNTREFVQEMRKFVSKIVWLNPVSKKRWSVSSSDDISKFVNMVEFNPSGFHLAIQYLRGSIYGII